MFFMPSIRRTPSPLRLPPFLGQTSGSSKVFPPARLACPVLCRGGLSSAPSRQSPAFPFFPSIGLIAPSLPIGLFAARDLQRLRPLPFPPASPACPIFAGAFSRPYHRQRSISPSFIFPTDPACPIFERRPKNTGYGGPRFRDRGTAGIGQDSVFRSPPECRTTSPYPLRISSVTDKFNNFLLLKS